MIKALHTYHGTQPYLGKLQENEWQKKSKIQNLPSGG